MTIYVHEPLNDALTRGDSAHEDGGVWSHLATDGDTAELLALAESIGGQLGQVEYLVHQVENISQWSGY